MYGTPAPLPVELGPATPAAAPEPCARTPEAIVPPGQTPLPTADGELSLVNVRGEDRLAITGYVAFTWSHDGEKLISASNDGVMVWNAATGVLERRMVMPTPIERPHRVVLSPDGQWIAFVAYMVREDTSKIEGPGVFLMRANGEGEVRRFEKTGNEISFSPDSRRLTAYLHEWDLVAGTDRALTAPKFEHETTFLPGRERAIVFVRKGKWPKEQVSPELREVATGKVLHRFPEINSSIGASLSGDGKRLALLQNGVLSVYSTETFAQILSISDVGKAQMVHISHDGRRAVTETLMCAVSLASEAKDMSWCPSPELTLWDLEKKEKILQGPRGSGQAWVFTPDGEYLTGPETRLVDYIVRVRDGRELRFGSRIRTISPGSQRVLYDGKLGFALAALDGTSPVPPLQFAPRVLARSADGRLQVIAGAEGRLQLEGTSSCIKLPMVVPTFGEPRSRFDYFSIDSDQLEFSPDGASLFVAMGSGRFRAFDTATGKERWSIEADRRRGGIVQLLPRSNQVFFQGGEHPDIRRFNATTGEELPMGGMPRLIYYTPPDRGGYTYEVRGHDGIRAANLYRVLAKRNGTSLGMASILEDKCAFSFWDLRNPREVKDLFPGCMSNPKALSPDEKWIAAGTVEGRAMLLDWNGEKWRLIDDMHEGKTVAVAFTPSGHRFLLADDRGHIVIADPQSGKKTGKARLPLDHAQHLWVSPDSQMLVVDTARGMRVRLRIGVDTNPVGTAK